MISQEEVPWGVQQQRLCMDALNLHTPSNFTARLQSHCSWCCRGESDWQRHSRHWW